MAELVRDVLRAMELLGFPMTITDANRSQAQQFELFKKGRRFDPATHSWVPIDPVKRTGIVTNADGTEKRSNHQPKADGKGRAVDMVFLIDGPDNDGELETPSWAPNQPWHVYGTLAEHLGRGKVRWLGRGPTLVDMPHIEWVAD